MACEGGSLAMVAIVSFKFRELETQSFPLMACFCSQTWLTVVELSQQKILCFFLGITFNFGSNEKALEN